MVPFRGIVMYATPLCYLYANPPDLYFTYRALYAQVLNLLALLVLDWYKSTNTGAEDDIFFTCCVYLLRVARAVMLPAPHALNLLALLLVQKYKY